MHAPLVSVIIPCYKMGRYVAEALESVAAQTYPHWEVVVVDDAGPEDGTRQAVGDFAERVTGHKVEYLRHEVNRGVSAARNSAIRSACGEWLAFLDPDDVWFPEKLERQLERVRSGSGIVGCFAFGRIERVGAGSEFAPSASIMGAVPAEGGVSSPYVIASGRAMFPFSSVLLRREIMGSIGGFQEGLPFQNEDRLMLGCAVTHGQLVWLAEPLCVYRVHDGSATTAVIKQKAATMIDFDLAVRLALWLRAQSGLRPAGRSVVRGVVRDRLRLLLAEDVWLSWRGIVVDLCARLALAYPGQLPFLIFRFTRHFLRLALQRMSSPREMF